MTAMSAHTFVRYWALTVAIWTLPQRGGDIKRIGTAADNELPRRRAAGPGGRVDARVFHGTLRPTLGWLGRLKLQIQPSQGFRLMGFQNTLQRSYPPFI